MTDTRSVYLARLNQVLDYLHANLDQSLSLAELAAVAGFSPFHFHRIFKSLTGEPLNAYLQRVRLEKAANLLLNRSSGTLLDIALRCGFSSAATFSRAFKAHFGLAPSQFEKRRKLGQGASKPGQDFAAGRAYTVDSVSSPFSFQRSTLPMNVQIKHLPDLHLAFVRHLQGYRKGVANSQIGEAFQKVCRWAGARDLLGPDTLMVGIPYDNPEITPNDKCHYDACVTVPREITAAGGEIGIQDMPGGKYAVCHLEVGASQAQVIGETVDGLYREWLPESGYQADDKPPLEIYYQPSGEGISMDYCLPLKPL